MSIPELRTVTPQDETARLNKITQEIEAWWKTPRFNNVNRPYTARQVAALRPTVMAEYPANHMSRKLFWRLKDAQEKKIGHMTWGALDTVQVANLAKYQKCVYVSGWQCSATASTTNEPGPDFADYPANTVPNKVDQLFRGLVLQDKIQNQERAAMTEEQRRNTPRVDYMVPMIADADAGFGGVTSTMKLMKMMIEAGAAGIHIEDQRPGNKKCGHMGGKVIVSCREHMDRLTACRLMADIMGNELVILARSDALSAKIIDSNIDPVDQPFILGVCADGQERTYVEEGFRVIKQKLSGAAQSTANREWEAAREMGIKDALALAKRLNINFDFDWEACRTIEGFYKIQGSVELVARRAREYLKIADMVWMETPTPTIKVAEKFARLVKEYHPTKLLAYNLSPSFNWSAHGMSNEQIQSFCTELGRLGYVYQFITLAGFHLNALKSEKMAKDLAERQMLAYVETVQRKEEKHNVKQLTHQKWSGANYIDSCLQLVQKESNTLASSAESTENQFKKH